MEELQGEGCVGRAAQDVGSTLSGKQHLQHLLEHRPAVLLLEGDVALQALEGSLVDVDQLGLLLVETDETELDHVDSSYTTLNDPLLKTAAVGQILLEHKSALSFLDVTHPASVSACLHETANHAGNLLSVLSLALHLDAVYSDCSIDVDVIQGYLDVLLDIVKLFFFLFPLLLGFFFFLGLFFVLLLLRGFLLDLLSRGQQVLEHFGVLSGSQAVILDLPLITRHVVCGVFVRGKEFQVPEIFVVVVTCLVPFEQHQVTLLFNVDTPGVLSAPNSQYSQQELNRTHNALSDRLF